MSPRPGSRWVDCLPDWGTTRRDSAPYVVGVRARRGCRARGRAARARRARRGRHARLGYASTSVSSTTLGAPPRRAVGISRRGRSSARPSSPAGGALFCGPVGGRFVYDLRARFDLYCKLVPLRPSPGARRRDRSSIAPDLADVDVLLVRENVGRAVRGAVRPARRRAGGVPALRVHRRAGGAHRRRRGRAGGAARAGSSRSS